MVISGCSEVVSPRDMLFPNCMAASAHISLYVTGMPIVTAWRKRRHTAWWRSSLHSHLRKKIGGMKRTYSIFHYLSHISIEIQVQKNVII